MEFTESTRQARPIIWNTNRNKPYVTRTVNYWIVSAYKRAVDAGDMIPGLKISPHILRHSAARHWLMDGVPLNIVSNWLGHDHLITTQKYTQVVGDHEGYMDRVS